jgi:hypothetical protein
MSGGLSPRDALGYEDAALVQSIARERDWAGGRPNLVVRLIGLDATFLLFIWMLKCY